MRRGSDRNGLGRGGAGRRQGGSDVPLNKILLSVRGTEIAGDKERVRHPKGETDGAVERGADCVGAEREGQLQVGNEWREDE